MTPSQAWDKFVESLPKGAQQNIRDSVQLGTSHTFDAFNAGFEAAMSKPRCNPHPKAPHGFSRNSSHTSDRYVCECEGWDAYEAGRSAGFSEGVAYANSIPTDPEEAGN